ncbi:dipeptidase [Pseudoclavibacter sp. RFBJ3]|uniref:dipeptidase n=1 Tax=unclassified Pseudoclavibacter TaxID=2615177 RepID=UPI000CE8DE14|nr:MULTISPECIES: dipeptidase [unclassified Pseudoclavibacter]PPF84338.1 dipeptidase [Pseudoclavibacter sp. RFBJ5]PPF92762.1 dipeptidase [Pseudoclavibacter sp. RFBJ3]PPF98166.1 dipeptidase [Pseudoclavibacter sp. RFBH5]PPG25236.1 dipeptidase [Pseudoclavibacter sp. RFBI4]
MTLSDAPLDAHDQEQALLRAVEDRFPTTIARLAGLVRIPSVSWDAFDRVHVRRSAERTAELLRETGVFESVDIDGVETADGYAGQPAVIATRAAEPGQPTVLLYAHHDVQPQGSADDWRTPPFEPTLRDGRLYGRGASDDKAGVMAHIAAVEALSAATAGRPKIGISVFIEGEEENGSRSFADFLEKHKAALGADAIIVADSDNPSTSIPGLTVSLRGNVTMKVTVRTLGHASHSGMLGGAVPDAMLATVRLLDSLWDERGAVAVTGLGSRADGPSGGDEADVRRDAELLEGVTTIGTGTVHDRLWNQPAITITGIDAPSVDEASNTLLPAVSVRLSARIAPGDDASRAFEAIERHLREHAPFGAHIEITQPDLGQPFLVDTAGPAVGLMKTAMEDGWGAQPEETGIGGSIPFIAALAEVYPEAEILVTGVEDPATMAHSPNESQDLGVLRRAISAEALFLHRFARPDADIR